MWSTTDPVTLFGALRTNSGWDDVSTTFRWLASRFSDCTSYDFEIVAAGASGDLAYTVGYEHTTASRAGAAESYTLRVTHIYRREKRRVEDRPPPWRPGPAGSDLTRIRTQFGKSERIALRGRMHSRLNP